MNLEESNRFVENMEKNSRNQKEVLTIIIACAILVVFLVSLVLYLKYQDSKILKIYYDDSQVNISASDLIKEDEGVTYFNIKNLASILGYSYQNGEYKKYNENDNSCFIQNNYVIISMSNDKSKIIKYLIGDQTKTEENPITVYSEDNTSESITLEKNIKYIDDGLYASIYDLSKIFNVKFSMPSEYRMSFYSMNYLMNWAGNVANAKGYKEISYYYENTVAISNNMLVVSDGKKWGVISLSTGDEIIGLKYDNVIYMHESNDFLVSAENSLGVISAEGETLIKPTEYKNISKLAVVEKINEETNEKYTEKLYLAKKNGKYGVINDKNEIIIDIEYDSIGIDNIEYFTEETFDNEYILFEDCIPVKKQNKVGIIDIYGVERLQCTFDSLGYIEKEDDDNSDDNNDEDVIIYGNNNVLTIPETTGIKGIVIEREGLYGIYDDISKKIIAPCRSSKIYSKKKSNVLTYYLEYNGTETELIEYLQSN